MAARPASAAAHPVLAAATRPASAATHRTRRRSTAPAAPRPARRAQAAASGVLVRRADGVAPGRAGRRADGHVPAPGTRPDARPGHPDRQVHGLVPTPGRPAVVPAARCAGPARPGVRGLAPASGKGPGGGLPPAAEGTVAHLTRTRTRNTRTAEETHP
ncbi:hypothetical protein [Streptomyces sp. NPDC127112]|uniref:hypothetical protein n=1 Tax=Streptomyces sp. NPDC127112 TaxID=3345364 RepID=UPI00362E9FD4